MPPRRRLGRLRRFFGWRLRLIRVDGRRGRQRCPETELPTAPTAPALAEAVALIAGRAYRTVNLGPSGDVPTIDLIRALVNIAAALLTDAFPDDHGERFLRLLGADAAGREPR